MQLPPPEAPFPVRAPYTVLPDMQRMGGEPFGQAEMGHFRVDELLGHYLGRKLAGLEEHAAHCRRLVTDDETGLRAALWAAFATVADEHPELVTLQDGGFRLHALGLELDGDGFPSSHDPTAPLAALGARAASWLEKQSGLLRLADALALAVQEDYVVLRGEAAAHASELLHVCFPSHWRPTENAGLSFAQIHAPVAHNARLIASAPNVTKALFSKGPFVRYTWGLVTDPRLEHNPALPGYPEAHLPLGTELERLGERVFLRVERQTTLALPAWRRCLFTIRVSVQPLAEALNSEARKEALAGALASMDVTLLRYKGLTKLRAPLLAWLRQPYTA